MNAKGENSSQRFSAFRLKDPNCRGLFTSRLRCNPLWTYVKCSHSGMYELFSFLQHSLPGGKHSWCPATLLPACPVSAPLLQLIRSHLLTWLRGLRLNRVMVLSIYWLLKTINLESNALAFDFQQRKRKLSFMEQCIAWYTFSLVNTDSVFDLV